MSVQLNEVKNKTEEKDWLSLVSEWVSRLHNIVECLPKELCNIIALYVLSNPIVFDPSYLLYNNHFFEETIQSLPKYIQVTENTITCNTSSNLPHYVTVVTKHQLSTTKRKWTFRIEQTAGVDVNLKFCYFYYGVIHRDQNYDLAMTYPNNDDMCRVCVLSNDKNEIHDVHHRLKKRAYLWSVKEPMTFLADLETGSISVNYNNRGFEPIFTGIPDLGSYRPFFIFTPLYYSSRYSEKGKFVLSITEE